MQHGIKTLWFLFKASLLIFGFVLESGVGIPFFSVLLLLLILMRSSSISRQILIAISALLVASLYAVSTAFIFLTLWISWLLFQWSFRATNRVTVGVFLAIFVVSASMMMLNPSLLQFHLYHPLSSAGKLLILYIVVQVAAMAKWGVVTHASMGIDE